MNRYQNSADFTNITVPVDGLNTVKNGEERFGLAKFKATL